jgi:hypothetical protein
VSGGYFVIFHDVPQNSPEWEALRIGKATASNFACIMAHDGKAFGDPAKSYALRIALERVTGRKAEYSFKNDDMARGHEQEPVARMLYEEMFFVEVANGGFFDHGTYGDSPDGLICADGILEVKSVVAATHYATLRRKSFDPAYRWQLVGHIDCTERQWVDFGSYCADFPESQQLIVHRLHRAECEAELIRLRQRRADFLGMVDEIHNQLMQEAA